MMVRVGALFPLVVGHNASGPRPAVDAATRGPSTTPTPSSPYETGGGLMPVPEIIRAADAPRKTPRRTTADDIYSRHLMCRSILGHRRRDDGSLAAADVDALELLLRGDV